MEWFNSLFCRKIIIFLVIRNYTIYGLVVVWLLECSGIGELVIGETIDSNPGTTCTQFAQLMWIWICQPNVKRNSHSISHQSCGSGVTIMAKDKISDCIKSSVRTNSCVPQIFVRERASAHWNRYHLHKYGAANMSRADFFSSFIQFEMKSIVRG